MAPREIYKTADGARVPSVTTIISRFKDSGGLLYWANQQGLDGKTLEQARQPAATSGTMAHDMIEAVLNGEPEPELRGDPEVVANARRAFAMYEEWRDGTKMEILHTEVSLVSEVHRFGGRLDAIGSVGNALCLVDWKTSNSVYADYLYQVAAYTILWEENYPEHPLIGGVHLCRFAKDHADFTHQHFGDIEDAKETFLQMRRLYDMVKATEKRVR